MDDCIFCKILGGEIPSKKLYEDEDVLAFLDINPANPGHSLVITKKHYETLPEVPDRELEKLVLAVKKIASVLTETVACEGYNIHQANLKAAGQVVPHVHFHIIPRRTDDFSFTWTYTRISEEEMDRIRGEISGKIAGK